MQYYLQYVKKRIGKAPAGLRVREGRILSFPYPASNFSLRPLTMSIRANVVGGSPSRWATSFNLLEILGSNRRENIFPIAGVITQRDRAIENGRQRFRER